MEVNEAKIKLQKTLAAHRLEVLSNFRETPIVEIKEIPKTRTKFPNTKNDYWYEMFCKKENKVKCIYELGPNSIFCTHKHSTSKEFIKILTKKAKVEWVNERGIFFKGYNDFLEADINEKHALVNLSNFTIELEITWHPYMKGWVAEFNQLKQNG